MPTDSARKEKKGGMLSSRFKKGDKKKEQQKKEEEEAAALAQKQKEEEAQALARKRKEDEIAATQKKQKEEAAKVQKAKETKAKERISDEIVTKRAVENRKAAIKARNEENDKNKHASFVDDAQQDVSCVAGTLAKLQRIFMCAPTTDDGQAEVKGTSGERHSAKDADHIKNTFEGDAKKGSDKALSPELEAKLKEFWNKIDSDHNVIITKDEAVKFWGKNFAKINATSMFNEVDEDGNGEISYEEFQSFWKNVIAHGYEEEEVLEEVQMMIEGGSWVDFNDGRNV